MFLPRKAGSQPSPIRTEVSSGLPPLTRETVACLRRLTRPLSRLILPPAGAGACAGAAGGIGAVGTGVGTGVGAGAGGATGGATGVGAVEAAGAAGSSTVTPKSVAMPASPLAYPWPTARTFHASPRR